MPNHNNLFNLLEEKGFARQEKAPDNFIKYNREENYLIAICFLKKEIMVVCCGLRSPFGKSNSNTYTKEDFIRCIDLIVESNISYFKYINNVK